jgi:8-hydroxy-5-deazaflavin:NADPH oxidoreductase
MKVGIFGTGMVGRILAEKFVDGGNEVMIGTRNIEDTLAKTGQDSMRNIPYKEWQEKNPSVKLGTFRDAAKFGEIIFIATFGNAATEAIQSAGIENFTGKIIIDTTNPLDPSKGVPPAFTATIGNSLGEQIQRLLPEAKVVKAFNTLGMAIIVNPKREEGDPVLFIAGNDESAKKQVEEIARSWGWKDIVDFGDISEAFWLEAFGMIWIRFAFKNKSWSHAFSLLKK